jgi:hypothetical protein
LYLRYSALSPKLNNNLEILKSPFDIEALVPSEKIYSWESEIGRFIAFWGKIDQTSFHTYPGTEAYIDYVIVRPLNAKIFEETVRISSFDKKSEVIYVKSPLSATSFSTLTPLSVFWNNINLDKPVLFTVSIGIKNKLNSFVTSDDCPSECKSRWNDISKSVSDVSKIYEKNSLSKINSLAILDNIYQ